MNAPTRILLLAISLGTITGANATILAYDNAADPAYTGGNIHGLNGGFGFGTWMCNPNSNGSNAGNFQYTSSQNGNGTSGNIDSSGKSWGLYSNGGVSCQMVRQLSTLPSAVTITADWDNGYIDQGGLAYMQFDYFKFGFDGGGSSYWYDIGTGQQNTGLPFTTDGMHIKLVLNGTGGFNFSVSPNNSTSVWAVANPFSGGSVVPTFIAATSYNSGNGASNNAYLNNLKIEGTVPEPASLVALGFGLLLVRKRKV